MLCADDIASFDIPAMKNKYDADAEKPEGMSFGQYMREKMKGMPAAEDDDLPGFDPADLTKEEQEFAGIGGEEE